MDLLIPGLPDDVARECLARVPYQDFRAAALVCKRWKAEIESPDLLVRRKAAGTSQVLVVFRQDSGPPLTRRGGNFQLSVFEPLSGRWSPLTRNPSFGVDYLWSGQLAAIGSDLVVFGWPNAVWIYNIQTSRWRPGTDMPRRWRTGFACATDGERVMYVAGGTSTMGGRLRSALAYDLKTGEWDVSMPPMSRMFSGPCKGIFRSGKFQVITTGPKRRPGSISIQTFDPSTRRWEPARVLETRTCLEQWVSGNDTFDILWVDPRTRGVCGCKGSEVWKVADLPPARLDRVHLARWHEKLMVVGTNDGLHWPPYEACILDLISYRWTPIIEFPEVLSRRLMYDVCCLEI